MKAAYVTDNRIVPSGSGGGTVSFHELKALRSVASDVNVYQHLGLIVEKAYPNNPFMYDYYISTIIDPEVEAALFYGSNFTNTMKMLKNAKKVATVPAHNLELSLEEWKNFPWWSEPPAHLTDPFIFSVLTQGIRKHCDLVVTPSSSSAKYLKEKIGIKNLEIIPHGVDIPQEDKSEKNDFIAFHLSQFGPDKGQKYLIKAWEIVQNREEKGTLVTSIPSFMGDFDGLLSSPSLKRNFILTKWISEDEKRSFYEKASVYIQSSVTEGWGLEVGEAMSYGTPVIVTEGTGAKDMVEDGKDGFIVPIRDPKAIADKIWYFMDNPSEVKRMGKNARQKAEQYSWDIIEAKYVKTVEELI